MNDILPKLLYVQYLLLIDARSGYNSLDLDKIFSYLATFACPFSQYIFARLLFRAVPAGDILQKKKDKKFEALPYIFCIADDILIIDYEEEIPQTIKEQ